MDAARILLVEDSPAQVEVTRACLRREGYDLRVAGTAADALGVAQHWRPDAVLLDLGLPDATGFDVMQRLHGLGIDPPFIVVTGDGSIAAAVEAMRRGARDFVVKPFAKARLIETLGKALQSRSATGCRAAPQQVPAPEEQGPFARMVGRSDAIHAVRRSIAAAAASRAAIFITGESGTGKELAAEALHRASPRAAGPFVALNCAAIPRDLLESEIFGHAKGAFTGAVSTRIGAARAAHGGTLFLDEVCEMPLEMQAKLLRFVQTGRIAPVGSSRAEAVDVRFVAATNRDPQQEVRAGRFREDLYYRLYVVPIEMPPLRARAEDVLLIARDLLARTSREEGRCFRDFAPDVAALLRDHPWPGNVRQLQNVIRNIVVLHDATEVTREMLPAGLLWSGDAPDGGVAPCHPHATPEQVRIMPLAVMERRLIEAALAETGQDVVRAAVLLDVNPSTIYRRLQAWRAEARAVPDAGCAAAPSEGGA